jgi:DNA transformation protein
VDAEHIRDLFAGFGPIAVRAMFGGAGLYADGLMFALVVDDVIYLKADDDTMPVFAQEGMGPFTYAAKGGTRTLRSYWRMPDRLYDDPDELAHWAAAAFATARRKALGSTAKTAKSKTVKLTAATPKAPKSKSRRTGQV